MDSKRSDDNRRVPAGFSILKQTPEEFQIVVRKQPILNTLLFFLALIFLMSALIYISIMSVEDLFGILLLTSLMILLLTCHLISCLFGKTIVTITAEWVAVKRQLLGLHRTILIARSGISHLEETRDGNPGDYEDSWSLRIMGFRKCWLLTGQPLGKTRWLGRQLANFLDVTFQPWQEHHKKDFDDDDNEPQCEIQQTSRG